MSKMLQEMGYTTVRYLL